MVLNIAVTSGEPAGIGPEVCLLALDKAAMRWPNVRFSLFCDKNLLIERADSVKVSISKFSEFVDIRHCQLAVPVKAGTLCVDNVDYVKKMLDESIDGAINGFFDAICTAPVQKSIIAQKYENFVGHTEYFADRTNTSDVVMMLLGNTDDISIRVALATTHLPLAQVPSRITHESLIRKLKIINQYLKQYFGIFCPKIAVSGLNPHAGEGGKLGCEEIKIINPVIEEAKNIGIDASGPFPADTLFLPNRLLEFDCVLAMYHDQGLPVLKHMTFGHGVNVTLGLPIIRTSVDHGTALDLSGTGVVESNSMVYAIDTAVAIAGRLASSF